MAAPCSGRPFERMFFMSLPQDPMILLSYVNTKLRDRYASLALFCEEEGANEASLRAALAEVGYTYDPARNQFV